jgi:hypothetical protein
VEYSYSIAATWGRGTPILPEGAWVEPGDYTIVLKADGREQRAPLHVDPDPRVTGADYQASARFSAELVAPMAKAWRGYAETEAVRTALEARAAMLKDASLATDTRALAARLAPPTGPDAGFKGESGVLAGLETAAEATDAAPTVAMQAVFAQTNARLDADWAAWDALRTHELAALNVRLAAAGSRPVAVPLSSDLRVRAPEGGQDLP